MVTEEHRVGSVKLHKVRKTERSSMGDQCPPRAQMPREEKTRHFQHIFNASPKAEFLLKSPKLEA